MNEPYQFELIKNDNGIFDDSLGCTYVIHLEGNGRYDHIKAQLSKYKTSSKIYIVHNEGYKKGRKPVYVNNPPLDLIDTYLTILRHSIEHNHGHILILEDDFIFDEKILDPLVYNDINNFIKSRHIHDSFIYFLGCVPFISRDLSATHRRAITTGGTHALIYSSNIIKCLLNIEPKNILDWDNMLGLFEDKYMYHECLCYQPYPITDNSKYWGYWSPTNKFFGGISFKFYNSIIGEEDPKVGFKLLYERHIKLPEFFGMFDSFISSSKKLFIGV